MNIRKKVYGFLILLTVASVTAYWANQQLNPEEGESRADSGGDSAKAGTSGESIPVELAPARLGDISSFLSSTSNLRSRREVEVATQAEGIVREMLVEEGDFVKQGQVLCRLDDSKVRIRLQTARQKLAQARLQQEKAEIRQEKAAVQIQNTREDLARYQALFEEKLVSEREVAQLKYSLDELEHDHRVSDSEVREFHHRVEELEAEIAQAQLEMTQTTIRAPFAGQITRRMITVGQTVRSLDPLFNLADSSPLLADVFLSEKDAFLVHIGQPVRVHSGVAGSAGLRGKIALISPVVDQTTGTVRVTVELPAPKDGGPFKPGSFVRVEIETETRESAILIPKRAVMEEDEEQFVFVAQQDSVKRVAVEVGYQNEGEVEIRSGISEGEKVVVAGQGNLKDGSKIRGISESGAATTAREAEIPAVSGEPA